MYKLVDANGVVLDCGSVERCRETLRSGYFQDGRDILGPIWVRIENPETCKVLLYWEWYLSKPAAEEIVRKKQQNT